MLFFRKNLSPTQNLPADEKMISVGAKGKLCVCVSVCVAATLAGKITAFMIRGKLCWGCFSRRTLVQSEFLMVLINTWLQMKAD